MKAVKFLCPLIIYTSPLSAAQKYSRGKLRGKLQNEALSLAAFRVVYVVV